jgi:hypothetical protein
MIRLSDEVDELKVSLEREENERWLAEMSSDDAGFDPSECEAFVEVRHRIAIRKAVQEGDFDGVLRVCQEIAGEATNGGTDAAFDDLAREIP